MCREIMAKNAGSHGWTVATWAQHKPARAEPEHTANLGRQHARRSVNFEAKSNTLDPGRDSNERNGGNEASSAQMMSVGIGVRWSAPLILQ